MESATLAIIAGGRSARMGGRPKGLMRLGGCSILERLLESSTLFSEVFLVGSDLSPYAGFGLRQVADRIEGRGAPGGVHAALAEARTRWVVAVACDMPFVTAKVVGALLEARGHDVDAVCFEVNGRLEPLLAGYRTSLAPRWEQALARGPSFRDLYAQLRARVLPEAALRAADPTLRATQSINTPEQARAFGIEIDLLDRRL